MDILMLPLTLLFNAFTYFSMNFIPILIGVLFATVFLVLFLHRNLQKRPQWVFKVLARYASKLEPVQDWFERMQTLLLRERRQLEDKRKKNSER